MTDDELKVLSLKSTGCETPIEHLFRAGGVQRYHNEWEIRKQRVDSHTWRVLAVLLTIWPNASRNVIIATQFHDVGESLTGDLPAPLKWGNPELKIMVDSLDFRYTHDVIGVPSVVLSVNEVGMMKCSDYLELTDHCAAIPNRSGRRIMFNGMEAVFRYAEHMTPADRYAMSDYIEGQMPRWFEAGDDRFYKMVMQGMTRLRSRDERAA